MREFTEQEQVRRDKVQDLIEKGVEPFGSKFDVTSNSKIIKFEHANQSKEELEELKVFVKVAEEFVQNVVKVKLASSIFKINMVKSKSTLD